MYCLRESQLHLEVSQRASKHLRTRVKLVRCVACNTLCSKVPGNPIICVCAVFLSSWLDATISCCICCVFLAVMPLFLAVYAVSFWLWCHYFLLCLSGCDATISYCICCVFLAVMPLFLAVYAVSFWLWCHYFLLVCYTYSWLWCHYFLIVWYALLAMMPKYL